MNKASAKTRADKPSGEGGDAYQAFVKMVSSDQRAWGLWRDGWALEQAPEGKLVFPLWPSEEAAKRSAVGAWKGFSPEAIPMDDLLDQLLPQLAKDKVEVGLSPPPGERSKTPPIASLISDLEAVSGRNSDDE